MLLQQLKFPTLFVLMAFAGACWQAQAQAQAQAQVPAPAQTQSWSEVFTKSRSAIPVIRHRGGICSGSLIGPRTLLTAHHCVSALRPITVQWFLGDKVVLQQRANVLKWQPKNDLAILNLDTEAPYNFLIIAKNPDLVVGKEHVTIGHPFGLLLDFKENLRRDLLFNYSKGMITKINEDNFITDMSLSPGNSGGPVLNSKGEIVGVVSAKVNRSGAGDIGLIIHPRHIQSLVEAEVKPLSWRNAESRQSLTLKEVYVNILPSPGQEIIEDQISAIDYKLWWKDRWYLGLDRSFSSSKKDIEYRGYSFGYGFYFESENFIPYQLSLGYKRLHFHEYDMRNMLQASVQAFGFVLDFAVSPENSKEAIFSIGLAL